MGSSSCDARGGSSGSGHTQQAATCALHCAPARLRLSDRRAPRLADGAVSNMKLRLWRCRITVPRPETSWRYVAVDKSATVPVLTWLGTRHKAFTGNLGGLCIFPDSAEFRTRYFRQNLDNCVHSSDACVGSEQRLRSRVQTMQFLEGRKTSKHGGEGAVSGEAAMQISGGVKGPRRRENEGRGGGGEGGGRKPAQH